jgi:outer membrane protein assembly factor BamA
MWLLNLEARPTLMEKPLWVLQGNLFTDFSKSWDATNFAIDGFGKPFASYGAGIRLILPKVYRAIIRFDLARTEQPIQQIGLNFGIQQFF